MYATQKTHHVPLTKSRRRRRRRRRRKRRRRKTSNTHEFILLCNIVHTNFLSVHVRAEVLEDVAIMVLELQDAVPIKRRHCQRNANLWPIPRPRSSYRVYNSPPPPSSAPKQEDEWPLPTPPMFRLSNAAAALITLLRPCHRTDQSLFCIFPWLVLVIHGHSCSLSHSS